MAGDHQEDPPKPIVFDEPSEQEIEPETFAAFLKRASVDIGDDQQLIIATSEGSRMSGRRWRRPQKSSTLTASY
jgi:hypothetical protein